MAVIRYFAAAAEAAGTTTETRDASDLDALKRDLVQAHGPHFERVLGRCAVLVNGVRTQASVPIDDSTLVDVLPPFAGG